MITKTVTLPNVADLDVEDAKQELRKVARKNRSKRSLQTREDFASTWVDTALDFLGDAQVVAAYVSTKTSSPRGARPSPAARRLARRPFPRSTPCLSPPFS